MRKSAWGGVEVKPYQRPVLIEYIWLDGQRPQKLRSKTKILYNTNVKALKDIPEWGFDGSSTMQAEGHYSDCLLKPVEFFLDPIMKQEKGFLALCEVFNPDGTPHSTNTRHLLQKAVEKYKDREPLFGIEQEYTLYDENGGRPYRWPPNSTAFPGPQGPYYCGVGSDEVYGRKLVEAHLQACLRAGLRIAGINAEVMPAQWEFQIGPLRPLEVSDQLWLARWLLYRIGEDFGISAKLHPKPIDGDWNGAGAHTNFSTQEMRKDGGLKYIKTACEKLKKFHKEHVAVYGENNDRRLTGKHETCDINTFRYGVGDRGASIRIPTPVANAEKGYLEDRRPAANMDPYQVCNAILETVCGDGFNPAT